MKTLLLLALAAAAFPARAESEEGRPERDDPLARLLERRKLFGERTPDQALHILNVAHSEAQRWGIGRQPAHRAARGALGVQGSAWINLGPTGASYEKNGVTYSKVDSGRIRRVLVHPQDPNIVYVATAGGGVWKSFDATTPVTVSGGPHWSPITEGVGSLAVGNLAMDPNNFETLVLGLGDPFDVQVPGLVFSTDGGASWSPPQTLSGLYPGSGSYTATSVREVQFDEASSGVVLAATDAGLFRSQQGGVGNDWKLVDLAADHSPQDCWSAAWVGQQTWLVACEGSLWRSIDGGASWASVIPGLPASVRTRVRRMTVAAAHSDSGAPNGARVYLLAAADDVTDPSTGKKRWGTLDLFRSEDGGQHWHGLGLNTTSAPTNANADQFDLDVLHDQAWYNQMLAVDPKNRDRVLVGGNYSMVRSRDGGASWDVMSNWLPFIASNPQANGVAYVHADWHAGTVSYAGDRLVFYAGTDGGVFRSSDIFTAQAGRASFEDGLNRGIVTHLAYTVVTDETDSSSALVLGGLQDNGTRLRAATDSLGGPTVFDQIWGGDGIGVGIGKYSGSSTVGSLMVVTTPGEIQRSQDGGQSFSLMIKGLPLDSTGSLPGFYTKAVTDFGDARNKTFLTLINASDARVYRWVDNGSANNSWQDITGTVALADGSTATAFPSGLSNLAADPMHAGQYGAVAFDRAYRKLPGSTQWTESAQTPVGALSSIAFDPADTSSFWVASASGQPGGHVFLTTDGGAHWLPRGGFGAGLLPDVPANVIKVDPNDARVIYAGTEIGLYRSTDRGQSWSRYGTGLPLVSVTDLSIALDSSAIRAATFGRGFWELFPSFAAPSGVHGSGDFDSNQQIDGFDLVTMAGLVGLTSSDPGYTAVGNLVGSTNAIDDNDLAALLAKLGSRP